MENRFVMKLVEFTDFFDTIIKNPSFIIGFRKAEKEMEELWEALILGVKENTIDEYADVILCLVHSAHKAGITPHELIAGIVRKIDVVKSRKWKENEDGTFSHIK